MADIILQDFDPRSEIGRYLATKTETADNTHLVVGASPDTSLPLHNGIILHCS